MTIFDGKQEMRSEIYWIDTSDSARLAIMARPRAGDWLEDEIAGWKADGVDVVVSLLEDGEISELGLESEQSLCAASGIEFISFPIADRSVPSADKTEALIQTISERVEHGKAVAIHCRAGIGRSALIAACVLVSDGMDTNEAFERISRARRVPVPDTQEQAAWVKRFSESRT
jgi:protein-tyrosine phosphatase